MRCAVRCAAFLIRLEDVLLPVPPPLEGKWDRRVVGEALDHPGDGTREHVLGHKLGKALTGDACVRVCGMHICTVCTCHKSHAWHVHARDDANGHAGMCMCLADDTTDVV